MTTRFCKLWTAAAFLLISAGCSTSSPSQGENMKTPPVYNDFSGAYDDGWEKANWANNSMFNCGWLPSHVTIKNNNMTLSLDNTPSHNMNYSGGEYRTKQLCGYGTYTVKMKPAACSGIVSSFFTYTGTPWDEIDIEFLGKDTTKVQFNYFVNGIGNHEHVHDLGFDAAEDFHTYAFTWLPDSISWYVDGTCVHTVTKDPRPSHPMQIMMNLWNGIGVDDWLGTFNYPGTPLNAEYQFVKFEPQE